MKIMKHKCKNCGKVFEKSLGYQKLYCEDCIMGCLQNGKRKSKKESMKENKKYPYKSGRRSKNE